MRVAFFFLFIVLAVYGFSQGEMDNPYKKQFPIVSPNIQFGNIIPTTDFVRGDNLLGKPLNHYGALTLKVLWQNPGYTNWQKVYRGPYYGGGFSVGDFYNKREVGNPFSLFGIFGIPIKRWEKLEFYSEFQYGLAWNWEHYDSISNPKNLVIGGGITVHLNIGLQAFYQLNKYLDLGGGFSFIHFSNGGFERPNRGFNIYTPGIELRYHLTGKPELLSIPKAGRLTRSNDLYFMAGYGDHQLVENELDTNS